MKSLFALSLLVLSSVSQAAVCDVEVAKNYVAGIELVASGVSDGKIQTGDKVNGKTIVTKTDVKAISADSAYVVTVTNAGDYNNNYRTTYSKYVVTLKQVGKTCFPASILLIGNTSNN